MEENLVFSKSEMSSKIKQILVFYFNNFDICFA